MPSQTRQRHCPLHRQLHIQLHSQLPSPLPSQRRSQQVFHDLPRLLLTLPASEETTLVAALKEARGNLQIVKCTRCKMSVTE